MTEAWQSAPVNAGMISPIVITTAGSIVVSVLYR